MKHYDVVVVGGGFAGVSAAIAAARQGRSVRLVEKYNCLGGAAVYDLVMPFMTYWTWINDHTEKKMISCGMFTEIAEELHKMKGFRSGGSTHFSEEYLKLIFNRMAIEAGVELLFQTHVTDVTMEGKRMKSITVSNVSGTSEIEADYFIDATGDANLSAMAGFPYKVGRESDGLCQPMTLCFRLGNVDMNIYGQHTKLEINELYQKFRAEGKIKNPREDVLISYAHAKGVLHFNTTRVVKLDPTNAEDVTKAELEAREQVFEIYHFLKENFPAFKNCTLLSTGMQVGVRESRMIVGEHTLTEEEMMANTRFDDAIAACNYTIDIHSPDGTGTYLYHFPDGAYYTIPYGCLVPKDSENLFVAGRCVSATHEAQASLRVMPTCSNMGEAAGVAAAVACADKTTVKNVDIKKVQRILRENGALID